MEPFYVYEILEATKGTLLCGDTNKFVTSVSIDSRNVKKGALFVPLVGNKFNAHDFICDAFFKGATVTLTSDAERCNRKNIWIFVNDTLKALQRLARYYRSKFSIPIIGITGSVGKTSCKEMISTALSSKKILKTEGNLNGQIGLPLTICNLNKRHTVAIIEMGMSLPMEMQVISSIAKPTLAVITNIGVSHIGNLKSKQNILHEKLHIVDHIDQNNSIFLNGDDKLLYELKYTLNFKPLFFGLSPKLDFTASDVCTYDNNKSCFYFSSKLYGKHKILLPVIGKHNIANALVAIATALKLGVDIESIKEGLSKYQPPKMRQSVLNIGGVTIIDDSYNASPDSAITALNTLKYVKSRGRKIAVFADMLELGKFSSKFHFDIGIEAVKNNIDCLITIGNEAKNMANGAKSLNKSIEVYSFKNNIEATNYILNVLNSGDTILIKGSRGMHTDEIVNAIKSTRKNRQW